jgi:hypothetical protein
MNKQPELDGSKTGEGNLIAFGDGTVILLTEESLLLLVAFTHNNVLNDTIHEINRLHRLRRTAVSTS